MRHRKLRIACSAVCGIVCVLLAMLWGRSFYRSDWLHRFDKNEVQTSVGSNRGMLIGSRLDWSLDPANHVAPHGWELKSSRASESHEKRWLGWTNNDMLFRVAASHWLAILLFAALAAALWMPWRFQLRTLLIATTLAAAVVAVGVATN